MGTIDLGLENMNEKSERVELFVHRVSQRTTKGIVVVCWMVVIGAAFVIPRQQQSSRHSKQALDARRLSTAMKFCLKKYH
jgi:hypothetical protein